MDKRYMKHSYMKYDPMTQVAAIVCPSGTVWFVNVGSASLHRLFAIAQSRDVRLTKLTRGVLALHHEGWNLFRTGSGLTMLPDSLLANADYKWQWVIEGACYAGCVKAREQIGQ